MLTLFLAAGLSIPGPAWSPHAEPPAVSIPSDLAIKDRPAPPLAEYKSHEIQGFCVRTDPALREAELETVLSLVKSDLGKIAQVIPPPALDVIRTVPIVITRRTAHRPGVGDRGACFHPSCAWLVDHGYDCERAGVVEVLSCDDYAAWRSIQPAMLLHELAHAFHWLLGFDRADVREAYQEASAGRSLYAAVAHVDGRTRERAYALTNHHEYFAELTEAFYWTNDFYPFTREELRPYDKPGADLVEKLWTLDAQSLAAEIARVNAREPAVNTEGRRLSNPAAAEPSK